MEQVGQRDEEDKQEADVPSVESAPERETSSMPPVVQPRRKDKPAGDKPGLGATHEVSAGPDRSQGGESDIVITGPAKDWHVEVKAVEHGKVYWSGHEVAKARATRPRYLMAIARREGDTWIVHWVRDPLETFAGHWRAGGVRAVWTWAQQRVDVQELPDAPWERPPAPCGMARRVSYVFEPAPEDFDVHGVEAIRALIGAGAPAR